MEGQIKRQRINALLLKSFKTIRYLIVLLPVIFFFTELLMTTNTLDFGSKEFFYQLFWIAIKWFSVGWSAFLLFLTINSLLNHKLIFGKELKKIKKITAKLRAETKEESHVTAAIFIYIFFGIIVTIGYFIVKNLNILFLLLIIIVRLFWARVRLGQPPVILFLSSSENKMILYNHYDLRMFVSPLRVVSLLQYSEYDLQAHDINKLYSSIRLDCFRTTFDEDWKSVIYGLIECVKVIIVDSLQVTENTVEETRYIIENNFIYKTIFLTNHKKELPLIEKCIQGSGKDSSTFCIKNYCEVFICLKSVFYDFEFPSPVSPLFNHTKKIVEEPNFHFKSSTAEQFVVQGNIFLGKRDFDRAEEQFLEALVCTPEGHESIWTNLAITSLNKGEYDKALSHIDCALKIKENHPNAIYTTGLIYEMSNRPKRAVSFYREFLSIAKPNDRFRINDATIRLEKLKWIVDWGRP